MTNETIAALASAPGQAGVAVIRMSGDTAYAIADQIVTRATPKPSERPAGTFLYAPLYDGQGQLMDDAIVLFFRAPHSYTGEDTIEFQVHGGTQIANRVLERLWQLGVRPAAPGEFTKRAFLNGRLDLTQAEGISDLIAAQTPRAERAAREALQGHLTHVLAPLYDHLLTLSSTLEHLLDFDEGELPDDFYSDVETQLRGYQQEAATLLDSWHEGRLVREGALVVIAGKPNAGKSSLLNLLLGYDRAIVSQEAGTTRDSIEETFVLDGIPIRLTDTAGLRDTACAIEHEGVNRAHALAAQADLVLYLIATGDDDTPPANALVLRTKADLPGAAPDAISILQAPEQAKQKVCEALREALHIGQESPVAKIANQRQYAELHQSIESMQQAQAALEQGDIGYVPAAQCLRRATDALGRILGKTYTDDLLDRVFSNFCVGK